MSKAEKFIEDYTKNCSNAIYDPYDTGDAITIYAPWLTPDDARRAVEIAREEIYEWINKKLATYIDYRCRGVGESAEEFINDLKKLKGED